MDLRKTRNRLLRALGERDRKRLEPHFTEQSIAFKQPLLEQGAIVEQVYFVESGVMSMVTDLEEGESVETGTVGNEGFIGLGAVLGDAPSPGRAFCQVPGSASVVAADIISAERRQDTEWFKLLLRYANFVTAMIGQTAACNRIHTVDARMSRWLLMTHDRVDTDEFPLTQEFLAQMLGVARPTVNIAGATLQRAGFIKYARGRITVLDRPGLESASCQCYWRIRDEYSVALNGRPARAARGRRQTPRESSNRDRTTSQADQPQGDT